MFFAQSAGWGTVSSPLANRRHPGLRALVLATVLALGSLPTTVWAGPARASGADVARTPGTSPATKPPGTPNARPTQRQAYAEREASAASQEKFEGGATTVWIGGSTLVIVLLVVLIVLLI
jgi:hypothetical protein